MLVLTRQRDESIMIGDNIVITIVDIRGDKVRLGISAPVEVPVHRQEVYEAIRRENARVAHTQPKVCPDCNGIGTLGKQGVQNFPDCPTCKGTGHADISGK